MGLFTLPAHGFFQSLRLSVPAADPGPLRAGAFELRLASSSANLWAFEENEHLVDGEIAHTELMFGMGLGPGGRLDLGFSDLRIYGGFMDNFIVGFHDATATSQNRRDDFPAGQVHVLARWNAYGPVLYRREGAGVLSSGFKASFWQRLYEEDGSRPALALGLTLYAPIDEDSGISRHFPLDGALTLSASRSFGRVKVTVAPTLAFFGADQDQGAHLSTAQVSVLAAVEWAAWERASLVCQYMQDGKASDNLPGFPRLSHELALGVKARLSGRATLSAALVENIITFSNSPDFALHAGISYRF